MAAYKRRGIQSEWVVTLKRRKLPEALQEICGLGQGERHFAVWAWLREKDEQRQAASDKNLEKTLLENGASFSNRAYFGEKATNAQAATLRKRRLSMEKRGFYRMYPPTPTGRHTTHIQLTEKGRLAGEFYNRYGGLSPIQVEQAVEASVEPQRNCLNSLNNCIMASHAGLSNHSGTHAFNEAIEELRRWHQEALQVKEDIEKRMAEFCKFLEEAPSEVARQEIEKVLEQRYWLLPIPSIPTPEFTDGGAEPWPASLERPLSELIN